MADQSLSKPVAAPELRCVDDDGTEGFVHHLAELVGDVGAKRCRVADVHGNPFEFKGDDTFCGQLFGNIVSGK